MTMRSRGVESISTSSPGRCGCRVPQARSGRLDLDRRVVAEPKGERSRSSFRRMRYRVARDGTSQPLSCAAWVTRMIARDRVPVDRFV